MAMTQEQLSAARAARNGNPGIGRRRLVKLTGCTGHSAARFLAGDYDKFPGDRGHEVLFTRPELATRPEPDSLAQQVRSINLHEGVRVLSSRPAADRIKSLLYGLRKGHGYPAEQLAEHWGLSVDTLRKHAKRMDCLRYVENAKLPGEWTLCVLHPDTAEDYRKDN